MAVSLSTPQEIMNEGLPMVKGMSISPPPITTEFQLPRVVRGSELNPAPSKIEANAHCFYGAQDLTLGGTAWNREGQFRTPGNDSTGGYDDIEN